MKNKCIKNPHGGDIATVATAAGLASIQKPHMDFSVNINPLGPPSCVASVLGHGLKEITQYPEIVAHTAESALADAHGVSTESVVAGNGSTEVISWLIQALKPAHPGWITPTYAGYDEVCNALGLKGLEIPTTNIQCENKPACKTTDSPDLRKNVDFIIDFEQLNLDSAVGADMIFLCSPNNPIGAAINTDHILRLATSRPKSWIVVDESFMDFVPDADTRTLIREGIPKNIIVIKSLTKFFAIPGLRLGMAYAHPSVIERMERVRLPWSVNGLAQKVAIQLYTDKHYIKLSKENVIHLREKLVAGIADLHGYVTYKSDANFILVKLPSHITATQLQTQLLKQGILIRSCANISGLGEQYVRIAVRPEEEIEALLKAIQNPRDNQSLLTAPPRTPAIMVVGTMSNSGKSITATALCRYFSRKGIKTAPFKAQNMALNSFVTLAGGEMGRAQVVQAKAAGVEPHVDMNPVLLKPMGDLGSQVIINGKSVGNYTAKDYYKMKTNTRQQAHEAYDRLASRYDLVILEGAGSPAEINLMAEDFVNMDMAEYAGASVILVADIDRGGVFASIFGTINLMSQKHRERIKGIIINKFRGDKTLLDPGIKQIEALTNIPVLGVLPYLHNIDIEDEDSLGLENRKYNAKAILDITVIKLPHISNYTDFLALEKTEGVAVRYLDNPSECCKTDLIIIPGTKSTSADLDFLNDSGWSDIILSVLQKKTPVFGICGGFQMLGSRIIDPSGIESNTSDNIGLNLLPISTVLQDEKELAQIEGYTEAPLPFTKPGTLIKGYEIHSGRSVATTPTKNPITITKRLSNVTNEPSGAISDDGLIFGCYIHGIFDEEPVRNQLLDWMAERKGIKPLNWETGKDSNEFDTLADVFMENINMQLIKCLQSYLL